MKTDAEQIALQRNRYPQLSDTEFRFMLQQVDGRQRTAQKLPTLAQHEDWWYPPRLSCEQCSGEQAARYKAEIAAAHTLWGASPREELHIVDVTGGFGVDTYFLSQRFGRVDYVEQNEELCRIARHNFARYAPGVRVHCASAETFVPTMPACDMVYIDPARRDRNGGKVFRIEDCTPNLRDLLPALHSKARVLLCKLSPMVDISTALRALQHPEINWDIHIVAVENEVKEVLLMTACNPQPTLTACNLSAHGMPAQRLQCAYPQALHTPCPQYAAAVGAYLYEPHAALLKAGLYNEVAVRWQLAKLAPNTHLYTSDHCCEDFPGRIWRVLNPDCSSRLLKTMPLRKTAVLTRNFPRTPEQLRRQLRLPEGEEVYLIGARVGDKPTLVQAERLA